MSRYDNLPPVPTLPLWVPGDEIPLRFVTHEAVISEYADDRDKPRRGWQDDWELIRCPECGRLLKDWGWFRTHVWQDYEMHVSGRHRGTKWAVVTVEGEADYGHERRDAGSHFSRHVDGRYDLLDFTLTESEGYRQSYTATFEVGRWRGDISNAQLSDSLNRVVDFDAFDSVEVEWNHRTPSEPMAEAEAIEIGQYEVRAVADGGFTEVAEVGPEGDS